MDKRDRNEVFIYKVIQKKMVDSKVEEFEGDGYSDDWHKEAERRGLPNLKTTPVALDAMVTKKAKALFESNGIYTHPELEARHEIELEKYIKKVQIEARVMGDLALNHILPAAIKYQNQLITNVKGLKELGIDEPLYRSQVSVLRELSEHIQAVHEQVYMMIEARKKANNIADTRGKAIAYCDEVKGQYFDDIRYHVDKLEHLVNDDDWTLPKYRELLFLR